MDNECIAFGDDLNPFPKEIQQFSIINYQLSISGNSPTNIKSSFFSTA